jgi:hypothetical protein
MLHWISVNKILHGTDLNKGLRNFKLKLYRKYFLSYLLKKKKALIKGKRSTLKVKEGVEILLLNTDNNLIKDWPKPFLEKCAFVDHNPLNKSLENVSISYEKFLLVVAYLYPGRKIKTRLVTIVINRIENLIKSSGIKVIYSATNTLISNAFLFVGFKLKKDTVIAQHGIYQLNYTGTYTEIKLCNHIIVWGKLFKGIYERNPAIKLTVLPTLKDFKMTETPLKKVSQINSILFIGTSDYKVDMSFLSYYQEFILEALKIATSRKIKCIYRPHPREKVNVSLGPKILSFIHNNKYVVIDGKSNEGDWKIGFFSTYLVELFLQGNFVSQVVHSTIKRDVLGNWFNINAINSIADFSDILHKIPFDIEIKSSDDYLMVEEKAGYRYYEFLENLLHGKNTPTKEID